MIAAIARLERRDELEPELTELVDKRYTSEIDIPMYGDLNKTYKLGSMGGTLMRHVVGPNFRPIHGIPDKVTEKVVTFPNLVIWLAFLGGSVIMSDIGIPVPISLHPRPESNDANARCYLLCRIGFFVRDCRNRVRTPFRLYVRDLFNGRDNALLYLWITCSTAFSLAHLTVLMDFGFHYHFGYKDAETPVWMALHASVGILFVMAHAYIRSALNNHDHAPRYFWGAPVHG
jgi:hypothetical protein